MLQSTKAGLLPAGEAHTGGFPDRAAKALESSMPNELVKAHLNLHAILPNLEELVTFDP